MIYTGLFAQAQLTMQCAFPASGINLTKEAVLSIAFLFLKVNRSDLDSLDIYRESEVVLVV